MPTHQIRSFCILIKLHKNQEICQNDNSQNNTVISEYGKIVLLNVSHKELDRKNRYKERYHASYQQDDDILARVMKTELEQFQSAGRYHGRNCEEKVNSAATGLATPMSKAPTIVAPDLEVPGTIAST